jgi:hypothetical protein
VKSNGNQDKKIGKIKADLSSHIFVERDLLKMSQLPGTTSGSPVGDPDEAEKK